MPSRMNIGHYGGKRTPLGVRRINEEAEDRANHLHAHSRDRG
jgi:hypothetical protein